MKLIVCALIAVSASSAMANEFLIGTWLKGKTTCSEGQPNEPILPIRQTLTFKADRSMISSGSLEMPQGVCTVSVSGNYSLDGTTLTMNAVPPALVSEACPFKEVEVPSAPNVSNFEATEERLVLSRTIEGTSGTCPQGSFMTTEFSRVQ